MIPQIYLSSLFKYSSSDAFVCDVLKCHFGLDRSQIRIYRGEFGKPYLVGLPDVHFNVSHASDVIICAINGRPIGIDIEKKRKVNIRVVNKFFTSEERDYILSVSQSQEERFTRIWTMKEAYAKWLGVGLNNSIALFNTLDQTNIHCFRYGDYYISLYSEHITSNQMSDICKVKEVNYPLHSNQISIRKHMHLD